ncbi:MAG: signal peptidase I [Nocardioides sp.]
MSNDDGGNPSAEPVTDTTVEVADRDADPVDHPVDAPPDDAGDGEPGRAKQKRKRKHLPLWQETILLLGLALVLAVVIKALFVQAFYIPSESMEPGLVKNDRILVQKVSYWFGGSPQRGDVVVFEDPGGWLSPTEAAGPTGGLTKAMSKVGLYPSGGHLVKRVVGVEGDTIVCCDELGLITVNGQAIDEAAYVLDEKGLLCNGPMTGDCNWTVGPIPDGTVFVMGDNRDDSADSTVHMQCVIGGATDCTDSPYVDTDLVVGKVFSLVWPSDRFDWIGRPDAFEDVPDAS